MGVDQKKEQAGEPEVHFGRAEVSAWGSVRLEAIRRRWFRVLCVMVVFAVTAYTIAKSLPQTFTASALVFALPAEGSPGAQKGSAGETVGLTANATDVVSSRRALTETVRALHLDHTMRTVGATTPLGRLLDALELVPTDVSPEEAATDSLDKRLRVTVKGAEVKITAAWNDPESAKGIVDRAVNRLLDARWQVELAPLQAKVTALNARITSDAARLDSQVAELSRMIESRRAGAKASTVRALQAQGHFRDMPDPTLSALRDRLISQRKTIAELEDNRRKRTMELETLLADQRATLGPQNPTVLETQEKLRALNADGKQVENLKADEQSLLAMYVKAGGNERELTNDPLPLWAPELKDDDEEIAFRRESLANAQHQLQQLRSEALDAEVALAAAKATFTARYEELEGARLPTHASSPKVPWITLAALFAGLLLGALWAVTLELGPRTSPKLTLSGAPQP